MPNDEELVSEILAGSQAAMEVLVKRYYKLIFSYIYRSIGDYHEAYDLTQEIFIKMMKNIGSYKERGKFKNWLLKIAVNSCNDYFRSRGFREKKSSEELADTFVDDKNNVWDLLSRKMDRKAVKNAVEELPDYQRQALILKFYHDLRIKDIAEVTGANEATVKSRLRQGLQKLGRILGRGDMIGQKTN